jgi:hypothetical protein
MPDAEVTRGAGPGELARSLMSYFDVIELASVEAD